MNTFFGVLWLAIPFLLIGGLVGVMTYTLAKPTPRSSRTPRQLPLVSPVRRLLGDILGS